MISFVVHERRRATAIRSALGASPGQLMWLHLRNGSTALLAAVPVGLMLSIAAAPFLGSLLYGVGDRDVQSLGFAALIAGLTGLLGTLLPVRRAANADPAQTLRAE